MSEKTTFVQPAVYQNLLPDLRTRLIAALGGKDMIVDRYAANIVSDLQARGEHRLAAELLEALPDAHRQPVRFPAWWMETEHQPRVRYAIEATGEGGFSDGYTVSRTPYGDTPLGSVVFDASTGQVSVYRLTWADDEEEGHRVFGRRELYSGHRKCLATETHPMLRAVYEQLRRDMA